MRMVNAFLTSFGEGPELKHARDALKDVEHWGVIHIRRT
jgi:hypothetical protein